MNRKDIRRLAGQPVMRRVDALRHKLRYGPPAAFGRWKSARRLKRQRRLLHRWFDDLRASPPDVLMGANVGRSNGIRHHMEGIRAHSAHRIAFAPPDELLGEVSYHDMHTTFRDEVQGFVPEGIRVVHSHVYPYYIEWCRRHSGPGTMWVHTYHVPYFPDEQTGRLEPWEEEINRALIEEAQHADVRVSVSQWQQTLLRDAHGIETVYIPNGVDVALCDRAEPARFREKMGSDPFVLWIGRDDAVKNPADFVRLAARRSDLRFIMMGGGLTRETVESSWGVRAPSNLSFAGAATRREAQDAIAASAAVVVTNRREGLPTVVLEAMVHSRPVVVPEEPGCLEAIGGGKFGFAYRKGNLDDLERCTAAAVAHGTARGDARSHVLSTYDWRVVAQRIDSIYSGQPA